MTAKQTKDVPVLEVYRDDACSPAFSSTAASDTDKDVSEQPLQTNGVNNNNCCCKKGKAVHKRVDQEAIEQLIKSKEAELKNEFEKRMEKETTFLKERFDFILQNEQIRASYMLREAHRERQEKVTALQTQLECKNLAGLMYVMCSEKRRSKLEKLRIIEEYTNYIHYLQDILTEAQTLILHLSRGYKTAAKVDHEWRQKMIKIIKEFQMYIYHFGGGTPESNQYLFDLPALMKLENPVVDNPEEDPCEPEEVGDNEIPVKEESKNWWEKIEGSNPPFIMFGDMSEFQPPQRRQVLKAVRAAKTAPKKWKEYVFNDMTVDSKCCHADFIKDEYPKHLSVTTKWECQGVQTVDVPSRVSMTSRRMTGQSVDIRADMGSILKIITSHGLGQTATKTTLLGARDSMEIASTTKLREKMKRSDTNHVVINVGARRTSIFDEVTDEEDNECLNAPSETHSKGDIDDETLSALGSITNDSLQMIANHVKDRDHRINYEKVCPMEKCQLLQVDSFVRSLPPYMRASPFTYFEQTFEGYETCSPEQLEILKERIEESKKERAELDMREEELLAEWTPGVEGVGVQTSVMSLTLPPCTCNVPGPSPNTSDGNVFRMDDLIPIKMALDRINKECFYNSKIEFDRFKVIGEDSSSINVCAKDNQDFSRSRIQDIQHILKQHPSLLDIFQANAQC